MANGDKLSVKDFAAKIKAKYPEYKDIDDQELTDRIVSKYPEYSNQVDFEVKKKEDTQMLSSPEESQIQRPEKSGNGSPEESSNLAELLDVDPTAKAPEQQPSDEKIKESIVESQSTQVNQNRVLSNQEISENRERARPQHEKDVEVMYDHIQEKFLNKMKDDLEVSNKSLQKLATEKLNDWKENNPEATSDELNKKIDEINQEISKAYDEEVKYLQDTHSYDMQKEAKNTFENYLKIQKEKNDGVGSFESKSAQFVQPFYKIPGQALQLFGIGAEKIDRLLGNDVPAGSNEVYKAGESWNRIIEELAPTNPEFANDITEQLASGFGQVASMILTSGITGAGAPASAIGTNQIRASVSKEGAKNFLKTITSPTALVGSMQMSVPEYEEAIKKGATADQAFEVMAKNFVVGGVLEQAPVLQFMKRLNRATSGSFGRYVVDKGITAFKGGFEEGVTEFMQGVYANHTAKEVYDVTRNLFDGVAKEGALGFTIGFTLNALGTNVRRMKEVHGSTNEIAAAEKFIEDKKDQIQSDGIDISNPIEKKNDKKTRSYILGSDPISRKEAEKLIDDGNTEGLEVNNDSELEQKMGRSSQNQTIEVRNKEQVLEHLKGKEDIDQVQAEKIASEIDEVAGVMSEQQKISKEEAYSKIDINKRLNINETTKGISDRDIRFGSKKPKEGFKEDSESLPENREDITNQENQGVQEPERVNSGSNIEPTEKQEILTRREEIITRLKSRSSEKLSSGIDPEIFSDYVKLAKTYIDEGLISIKDFSKRFKNEVKKLFGIDIDEKTMNKVYESARQEKFNEMSVEEKEKSRKEADRLNKEFEDRQDQLAKDYNLTEEEIKEAKIEDKFNLGELNEKELEYVNENFFRPKGYEFDNSGSLIKISDPAIKESEAVKETTKNVLKEGKILKKPIKSVINKTAGVRKASPKKTITVNEASELRDQLRKDVKTATDAKNWVINNQEAVIDFIKKNMKDKGSRTMRIDKIRMNKAISLMKKISQSSKTDTQYKRKVSEIYDLLARESIGEFRNNANKLRKSVIKRKNQLRGSEKAVSDLVNINPVLVPVNKQGYYLSLLQSLSERGIPSGQVMSQIDSLVKGLEQASIDNEQNMIELADRIRYHDSLQKKKNNEELIDAVMDDLDIQDPGDRNVYRNYIKDHLSDLKKMSKDEDLGKITKEEADIDINETLEISKIIDPKIIQDERLASMVQDMKDLKNNDLVDFSRSEIRNLTKILDNLLYGYVSPRFRSMHDKIIARRNFNSLKANVSTFMEVPQNFNFEGLLRENLNVKSREKIAKNLEKAHLQNIEFMLGKVKNNAIYTKLINPVIRGIDLANQESDYNHKLLSKMFEQGLGGINRKKARDINVLMNMVMTERENQLNPDNNKSHSVADHIKALEKSSVSTETKKLYTRIYDKYSTDEGFDINAAVNELRGTKLKNPLKTGNKTITNADDITVWMRDMLDNNVRDKARFMKNYMEDEAFVSWDGYFPQSALRGLKEDYSDQIKTAQEGRGVSFKSDNLKERNSSANPIKFDAYGNFERAVRSINLQYYIQQSLNETQATLNLMQRKGDEQTKQLAGAIQDTINKSIEHDLALWDRLGVKGFKLLNHVTNKVFRRETMQTLSSVFRVFSEMVSNHLGLMKLSSSGKILASSVKRITNLSGNKVEMEAIGQIMSKYGSTQSGRLGRISDEREHQTSIAKHTIQSARDSDKIMDAYVGVMENKIVNAITRLVDGINKNIVSAGDSIMIKPVWWTTFKDEFERISGTQINTTDFNNRDFRVQYNRQIQEAIALADKNTSLVVNTGSPSESSIRDKAWRKDSLKRYATFLKGFSTNEAFIFRDAVSSLIGKSGTMDRARASKVLLGQLAQQSMYSLVRYALLDQFYALMANMFDWDEPEDKDVKEQLTRIGIDLLFTNSVGHWNAFTKTALVWMANFIAEQMEEEMNIEGVSDAIYEPDFNYTSSVLRNFGGVAGVAWEDISKMGKNIPSTLENLFNNEIDESEINTLIPLLKLTTGLPLSKDLEVLKKSQEGGKSNKRSSDMFDGQVFAEDIFNGSDFDDTDIDDIFE